MTPQRGSDILEVIGRIHGHFRKRNITLSVAESCTGGLISHYITLLPGASAFFQAGVVSYSEESKRRILHVSPDTIRDYGVVSGETVEEMAVKMRVIAQSDFSVATTGNLGPEVLEEKDRGLVYIAVSKEGKTLLKTLRLQGSREENKEDAAVAALKLLVSFVEGEPSLPVQNDLH